MSRRNMGRMGKYGPRCECVEIKSCKIGCRYWHGLWVISFIRLKLLFKYHFRKEIWHTRQKNLSTSLKKVVVIKYVKWCSRDTSSQLLEIITLVDDRIRHKNKSLHPLQPPGYQSRNIEKGCFKADNLIISSSLIFSAKLDQLFLVAKRSSLVVLCVRQSRFSAAPWNWIRETSVFNERNSYYNLLPFTVL